MDNRTLIEKAQLTISNLQTDGGYLPEAVSKEFLEKTVAAANFMPLATVRPMDAPTQSETLIGFDSRVLHAANPGQALPEGSRSKPSTLKVLLTAQEFKAECRLDYSVLEDSIEGDRLTQRVLSILQKRLALDMDDISLNSVTSSTDADLAKFNGIRALISTHTVAGSTAYISDTLFKRAQLAMPQQFLADMANMHFLTARAVELIWRNILSHRATPGSDRYMTENIPCGYGGNPITPISMLPIDLSPGTNSDVLFMNPRNAVIGVWKKIMIETDKDISAGELIVVARVRFDAKVAEENGTVKITGVLAA